MVETQTRPSARRGMSVAERNRELFEQQRRAAPWTDAGDVLCQAHRQQQDCEGG